MCGCACDELYLNVRGGCCKAPTPRCRRGMWLRCAQFDEQIGGSGGSGTGAGCRCEVQRRLGATRQRWWWVPPQDAYRRQPAAAAVGKRALHQLARADGWMTKQESRPPPPEGETLVKGLLLLIFGCDGGKGPFFCGLWHSSCFFGCATDFWECEFSCAGKHTIGIIISTTIPLALNPARDPVQLPIYYYNTVGNRLQ